VRLAALPDETWEGFPQRLDKPFMGVTGSDLNAGESSALELADEPAPRLSGLPESRLKTENLSLTRLIDAYCQHYGRRSHCSLTTNLQVHRVQHQKRVSLLLQRAGRPGLDLLA
jgi:hypothetical protein